MNNADFDAMYLKYRVFSIRIAREIVKDDHAAEDICQDVFAKLYKMGENLDTSSEAKLVGLIKHATVNRSIDYVKSAYKRKEEIVLDSDDSDEIEDDKYEVEARILGMEKKEYMNLIFQRLRLKNRTNYDIFVKVKIHGVPPASVAEEFHITTNSVNNRNMRTKRWLEYEMQKMYGD